MHDLMNRARESVRREDHVDPTAGVRRCTHPQFRRRVAFRTSPPGTRSESNSSSDRFDVLSAERPFQERVVFQVDLPDCEVVAGTPPRIDSGHLSIGKSSQFVSDLPESHIKELVRGWLAAKAEGHSVGPIGCVAWRLSGDFPPVRRRVAPYTAAWVRRCMPSLVSRPDT
jgi:hypothetical protein